MLMLNALARHARSGGIARGSEHGQATAEYAIVIVGAATIAGLVLAWAAGTGKITRLLNAVIDAVIGQVG